MSTLSVGSALAARGGHSNTNATLTLSPNPAPANSVVQVFGCGYTVGVLTEMVFTTPTATAWAGIPVDSNGCVATSVSVNGAGSYSLQLFQQPDNKWIEMASGSLTVQ